LSTNTQFRILDPILSFKACTYAKFSWAVGPCFALHRAQARSLLDFLEALAQHQGLVPRSGSISQGAALALYSNKQKQTSFDGCSELFPATKPINTATVPATMKPLALCSDNFAVLFSQVSKKPLVVVERLPAQICVRLPR
jgi:hypothetical protein